MPTLNVRFGSQADMCAAKSHVRYTPNSGRESGHDPGGGDLKAHG
jgi:hypothetical protein